MSKIFRGLLLNKYIDRRLLEEEKKSKKTRIFIFKVIFKYLEENNEIAEFPYDREEHALLSYLFAVHARFTLVLPSIKHSSNACRSLNFIIFYQTKYKTSVRRNI